MGYSVDKIRAFYEIAEDALERVRAVFAVPVKITLLVRVVDDPEGDIIVSDDKLDELIKMIERRKKTEPVLEKGDPLTKLH